MSQKVINQRKERISETTHQASKTDQNACTHTHTHETTRQASKTDHTHTHTHKGSHAKIQSTLISTIEKIQHG